MYESQIGEYKFEIDKLNKELIECKNKYFMQKKKEYMTKERDRLDGAEATGGAPGSIMPNRNMADQVKFIGGGFSLKTPLAKTNAWDVQPTAFQKTNSTAVHHAQIQARSLCCLCVVVMLRFIQISIHSSTWTLQTRAKSNYLYIFVLCRGDRCRYIIWLLMIYFGKKNMANKFVNNFLIIGNY